MFMLRLLTMPIHELVWLAGPDAVKELFGEAGSATDFIAKAADQPGFDSLFGGAYDFMSKNRFAISDAATKAKKAVGAE